MIDRNEVLSLLDKAYNIRISDLRGSISLAEKALEASRAINDQDLIARSLSRLSLFLMIMGSYSASREKAEEALQYFEALGDELGIADTKYNIAGIYYKTDNYHLGMTLLADCLAIYKKFNDYHNISRVEKSLGTIYDFFGDQNNSINSYVNAIDAARKAADLNLESNAYNNLSGVYLKQGKTEEALEIIQRSIEIKNQTGDIRGLAFSLYGRGKIYTAMGRYREAEVDLLEAFRIHEEMGERLGLGMAYHKLGKLYQLMGDLERAKEQLFRGLEFSQQYNTVIIRFKCDHLLYEIYKQEGNHLKALEHLERHLLERELVINTQTFKVIENYELIARMKNLEQEARLQREKAEILEKKNKAEEAVKVRQEFLSTMSHEIRTPLNAVITIISMLSDKTDEEERQLLDALKFASNNLLRIINDILDFTKLDAGKAKLELHPIRLKTLLENVWHTYEGMAREKGLKLSLKMDVGLAETYELDDTKLTQILGNLISNGIKFTKFGQIIIEAEECQANEEYDLLRFRITDTGEGIQEEDIDAIFESFSQIKPVTTRKQGGAGLGLAIVRKLVELHGGTIEVRSSPSMGSVFTFTIRTRKIKPKQADLSTTSLILKDKTVLLAEDNEINAFVAIKLLSKWGIKTEHALNGLQAVEKARMKSFDFILMDIHMPEMNGFDAAAVIRTEFNPNKHTPIFALTADITAGQQEDYCHYFNGFLWKPLQIDKLQEALTRV